MRFLDRVKGAFGFKAATPAVEGAYREGPYYLPVTGGWLSAEAGANLNWWQMGYSVRSGGRSAMVEACISAYAQTTAMCPGNHWKWTKEKGRDRVTNSALCRILKRPNAYQTISDFVLNLVRSFEYEGNGYALALRNDRFEITELHLMDSRQSGAMVATNGEVFYHLAGNEVIDRQVGEPFVRVPARDVLHIRLLTPVHPLVGESPLAAAAMALAASDAAIGQQIQFFTNRARPSFVLSTDQILDPGQVETIRERWNKQAAGLNAGGVPILTGGLKAQAIGNTAEEAQLVETLKMSDQAIATVYRVPLQVLGIGDTPYASTEALMNHWLSSGLGFVLNHIEEAIGGLFKLAGQPDEYLEFDTAALLRSNFKERVEGWAAGTKGGIFATNDARSDFELSPAEFGDEVRVQQQDVPLSYWGEGPPPAPAAPTPPNGTPPVPPPDGTAPADKQLGEAAIATKAAEFSRLDFCD